MRFYSTKNSKLSKTLQEAILKGLSADNGLFMPEQIPVFPGYFFSKIHQLSFPEIAIQVANKLIGNDVPAEDLEEIIQEAINFNTPLIHLHNNLYGLELFHGPTFAFKDVGARFMARLLGYIVQDLEKDLHVLVATSGDTGSAVANGFWKVPGIRVHVLYPKGLVSPLQEKQFTTLGGNITALEIEGTFDDCQKLVKKAFLDEELNTKLRLTSANSINIARLLPQSFYYFNGYAQLPSKNGNLIFAVPSGNFGNLTAGMIAQQMGLPVHMFIAATNINDIVPQYLETGIFTPRPSVPTIANAMDVGNPSNFVRILDLYDHSYSLIRKNLKGEWFTDEDIRRTISVVYEKYNYILDPHSATAYQALANHLSVHPYAVGIFLLTAHPAKFRETVEQVIGKKVKIPDKLLECMDKKKETIVLSKEYEDFRNYLMLKC